MLAKANLSKGGRYLENHIWNSIYMNDSWRVLFF